MHKDYIIMGSVNVHRMLCALQHIRIISKRLVNFSIHCSKAVKLKGSLASWHIQGFILKTTLRSKVSKLRIVFKMPMYSIIVSVID